MFEDLLENDGSLYIHDRNIQSLAIKKFNFLSRLSLKLMNYIFQIKLSALYSLRDKNELHSRNPKTATYGTRSNSFLTPKICSIVPQE